jgi:nucleoside-diphosphate-sugar epimerase
LREIRRSQTRRLGKLFTEELCRYYRGLQFETRIVRFHNVYGPLGTYEGGKEGASRDFRKVALADDKSKSGATANRHDLSCTLTIALKAWCA